MAEPCMKSARAPCLFGVLSGKLYTIVSGQRNIVKPHAKYAMEDGVDQAGFFNNARMDINGGFMAG